MILAPMTNRFRFFLKKLASALLLASLLSCGQTDSGRPGTRPPQRPGRIGGTGKGTGKGTGQGPHRMASSGKLAEICASIVAENKPGPLKSMAELRDRYLKTHNDIRSRYGLPDLVWDDQIAVYAQNWADYLRDNNKCKMMHRSKAGMREGKKYGENLAWNWTSAATAPGTFVESPEFSNLGWSKECADYNYADASCVAGEQCGHFTQVVWHDSERVGCGVAICDGAKNSEGQGRAEVWVCNYYPQGNIYDVDRDGSITPRKPF